MKKNIKTLFVFLSMVSFLLKGAGPGNFPQFLEKQEVYQESLHQEMPWEDVRVYEHESNFETFSEPVNFVEVDYEHAQLARRILNQAWQSGRIVITERDQIGLSYNRESEEVFLMGFFADGRNICEKIYDGRN